MSEKLVRVTLKCTKETNRGVSNFMIDSGNVESHFLMIEKFLEYFNQEFDTNFQIKDLDDMSNYDPDWEREK